MKRKSYLFLLLLIASGFVFSQQENAKKRFTNADKEFNDWSVSAFVGSGLLIGSDFMSWQEDFLPGLNFQGQINKQITHAFGLSLQYEYGLVQGVGSRYDVKTKHQSISLLGDFNLSSFLRRVDNRTEYKWAAHGYLGFGVLGYEAKRRRTTEPGNKWHMIDDVSLDDNSFYAFIGAGVRYKLNKRIDLEVRGIYNFTGDEEFDASGDRGALADVEEGKDDAFVTLSLGVHYKFGKHEEALQWHDPLSDLTACCNESADPFVCIDLDNDGVCDQWDRCPGTPEGVIVDGSGCPLDTDRDGVPDYEDECPTIPGPVSNKGCPLTVVEIDQGSVGDIITGILQGIEFEYDKADIKPSSYAKLDETIGVLEAHPEYTFYVEGHTDAAGGADYNQKLSERRAASVVRYLVGKGIPNSRLIPVGKGKSELKHPECDPVSNCSPQKNLENRRVVFRAYQEANVVPGTVN